MSNQSEKKQVNICNEIKQMLELESHIYKTINLVLLETLKKSENGVKK